jgi:hypothetical protein
MAIAAATISSRLWPGAGPRLPRTGLVQIGCRLASFTDLL